jgi:hypothetical protein
MGKLIGQEVTEAMAAATHAMLITDGWVGGTRGARAVQDVLEVGTHAIRKECQRADAAETALEFAQATIRAFVGDGPVPVAEPPKGHRWLTSTDDSTGPRLYCATCTVKMLVSTEIAPPGVRPTSAAECLAANR